MSENNGDKARFAKLRHRKILVRKHRRELLKVVSLGNKAREIQPEFK